MHAWTHSLCDRQPGGCGCAWDHGARRDHRVEQAERRERNGRDVVDEGPKQVLPDGLERQARELERLDDFERAAFDQHDVPGLDRDIRTGSDRDPKVRLRQRRSVIDAVADECDAMTTALKILHVLRLVLRKDLGEHLIDPDLVGD